MFKKKQLTSFVLAAYLVVSFGTTGTAAAGDFSLELDYWRPEVIGGETRAGTTENIKLEDDLGLGKNDASGVTLSFNNDNGQEFYVNCEGAKFKGTKNLTRSFSFDGGNYTAGDSVKSRLQVNKLQIGLRNGKVTSRGKFTTIYSYTHGLVRTELQDVTQNFSREKETSFDSIGLGFGWESMNAKGVNYFVETTPLQLSTKGGGYGDFKAGIKTNLSNKAELTLGYRVEGLAAIEDKHTDFSKPHLAGAYFSLKSNF